MREVECFFGQRPRICGRMPGMPLQADVVIAGAGIAGVSTAYHLSVQLGCERVILCDPRPPLTLTSDKSTECYRNWWPGPGNGMVALMNRSIDLLEEWAELSSDAFHLSRRGYLYATADDLHLAKMYDQARSISALGGGELRTHRGSVDDPDYIASHGEEDGLTHDGRLLYVAVTRAKTSLILLYTKELTSLLPVDESLYQRVKP